MRTLLLIDNQDITREGMKAVATRLGGFFEIKEAGTQKELTHLLTKHPDAVAVLDYTLLDTSVDYLLILQERFKEAHFILFSDSLSEDFIRRMVFSGTSFSVVMKDAPKVEIEEGLRKAKQHVQYICTRIAWQLQHKEEKKDESASPLTATEREILKLMALGKTTKEIAAGRFLSVYTVMTHRKNIFRKLEVNNVHEATKYALRAGIVDAVEYYI
ncbi:response regulator transcription factor [Phocaeicola sp.]